MRTLLGLLVLVLGLAAPGPALADEPAPVATTTTLTASVSGDVVTLTAVVTAADASVPEGTVVVNQGTSEPPTLTLVAGTASWTGEVARGWRSWTAAYVPTDDRWAGTIAPTVTTGVGDPCDFFVDSCGLPYAVGVRGDRRIEAGRRARLRISLDSRGTIIQPGTATASLTGPRGFSWAWSGVVKKHDARLVTPRLTRPGTYSLTVDARLDAGLEQTRTVRVRVVRRPARAL